MHAVSSIVATGTLVLPESGSDTEDEGNGKSNFQQTLAFDDDDDDGKIL
jgi:hypothetical protein